MAREIVLDLSQFAKDLENCRVEIGAAARNAFHDIMDDWKREAVDIAPLDKGTLRRAIHYRTENKTGRSLNVEGWIRANATEESAKWPRFNYAYYLHEVKGEIKNPTTSGTEAKFLDVPAERNERQWIQQLENEIKAKIRGAGF